jgi:hypothetical protein
MLSTSVTTYLADDKNTALLTVKIAITNAATSINVFIGLFFIAFRNQPSLSVEH